MKLQQLFTMGAKSAQGFLVCWNVRIQICDLCPMNCLAETKFTKTEGILMSTETGLSDASSKPSTATSKPPNESPRATEPTETPKPSSTLPLVTSRPNHPLK